MRTRASLIALALVACGCSSLLGLEEYREGGGGGGATGGEAGSGGDGAGAGAGATGGSGAAGGSGGGGTGGVPQPDPGTVLWAESFPASGIQQAAQVLAVEPGRLVVGGSTTASIDFRGEMLTANANDLYLAELTTSTATAQRLESSDGTALTSLELVGGEVVAGGRFFGALDLGTTTLPDGMGFDAFEARFGPGFALASSKQYASAYFTGSPLLTAMPNGDVIVAFGFSEDVISIGGRTLSNAGFQTQDIALARIAPNGTAVWAVRMGGSGSEGVSVISAGPSDTVALAGIVGNAGFSFGGSSLSGNNEAFLAVVDASGNGIWALDTESVGAKVLDVDWGEDTLAVAGYCTAPIDLGGAAPLPHGGGEDAFIGLYSPGGTSRWARTSNAPGNQRANAVAVVSNERVVFAGAYQGDLGFGSTLYAGAVSRGYVLAHEQVDETWQRAWELPFEGASQSAWTALDVRAGRLALGGVVYGPTEIAGIVLPGGDGTADVVVGEMAP